MAVLWRGWNKKRLLLYDLRLSYYTRNARGKGKPYNKYTFKYACRHRPRQASLV